MTHGLDTSFLVALEVSCHPDHGAVRAKMAELRGSGDGFAVAPQVLAEFVHVISDARRFSEPLSMEQALERAHLWWDAAEVERIWPDEPAVAWFFAAMTKHKLGRKRILDTFLAGTFHSAGIASILTLNAADFAVFGEFQCVPVTSAAANP